MRVDNYSISRFLSQNDMTFVIPVYQRNYDWQTSQCKQLIYDIENIINSKNNHFIGTVCVKPDGRYSCLIIDGQQRVTTLLLLFKVIYDLSDNMQLKRKIKSRFLIDEFTKDGVKLRLKPIKKDKVVFTKLIKNDCFSEFSFDAQDKVSNIYLNYVFMKEIIGNNIENGLYTAEEFEDAIERLEIVEIELDNENPQIIFESLNSTGLNLTDSDLLRNYLLMSLNYADQEYLYENYWRKIEECLHGNHKILEDFMVYYLITKKQSNATVYNGKTARINNTKLYAAFKRDYPHIDRSNMVEVENCFKEMLQYSKYYSHFIFDETTIRESLDAVDKLFYDLLYLMNCKDSAIVLMYLLNRYEHSEIDVTTLVSAIQALLSLAVRSSICDKRILTSQFCALLIQKLDKNNNSDDFMNIFWDGLTMGSGNYGFPKDIEVTFALSTKPLYTSMGSRKVKYMLYKLECAANPKENHIYTEGTIEHIMPQTLSEEWRRYLTKYTDLDNYQTHLHQLGNLCLTGYNSHLGNDGFCEKKGQYQNSNYTNTRSITQYTKWTSIEIQDRGSKLIKLCLEIWPLPNKYNRNDGAVLGKIYDLDSDFSIFTKTKPAELTFLGGTIPVTNWSDLVVSILEDCYEIDKQLFASLTQHNDIFSGNRIFLNTQTTNMNHPAKIGKSGIFVDTGNSVVTNLKLIQKVLEFYDNRLDSDLTHDITFTLSKV